MDKYAKLANKKVCGSSCPEQASHILRNHPKTRINRQVKSRVDQ